MNQKPFQRSGWGGDADSRRTATSGGVHDSRHGGTAEKTADSANREPIAIVGIGCRFPGGVNNPQSFWRLLCDEVDAITEMPPGRFDLDVYYSAEPRVPGKVITRNGGFLREIELFDNSFFGFSPREADFLDPQQRLLLEVGWESFEDAGIVPATLAGSRTGVFIGEWTNDYQDAIYAAGARLDLYTTTGGGRYPASGRLSYFFDLRGPSVTVDTACSSSSVAIHLACRSLWSGETTLALAGGVNVILTPQISIAYSFSGMLSPDGRCKFGDARADGFVRSDGAGIVVLKTLSRALADGNPIYALIRGSAVNNDGRGSDLLVAPSEQGQAAMLRAAYEDAGISPGRVGYVEAHGTGTPVGDPVELQALAAVLREGREAGAKCYVGSVKTNFGHTEGAAGVAGLIKAALCLKHRMIPRSLHFEQPSERVPWSEIPIEIPTTHREWRDAREPAFAGASAFGITGTNAHIVLEKVPAEWADESTPGSSTRDNRATCLIPISAQTPQALNELARANLELLRSSSAASLADFAYSQAVRRTQHEQRIAVIAHNRGECAEQLETFLRGEPSAGLVVSEPESTPARKFKTVFVFPGQGSQWFGMGRQLMEREPVFRKTIERCDEAIRSVVAWSLLEQLAAADNSPAYHLREIDVIQPTLVAIEVALATLWRSWGVEPNAVVGHSMGEVAAACVAGALSLEDAFRVICLRSQLLRRVSGRGAMVVVELTFDGAREVLRGYEDRVAIAVSNSPRSTVLSGDPAAIDKILQKLEAQGVFCRLVRVDVASHSPQMDPLLGDLAEAVKDIRPRESSIPICSTALAAPVAGNGLTPEYWVNNLRQPVLFSQSVERLLADEHDVFIEMSPQPILLPAIEQTVSEGGKKALMLASLRREEPEQETILASLGGLYAAGYSLDWTRLYPRGRFVRLPSYPWQRQRFWFQAAGTKGKSARQMSAGRHPLLGERFTGANGIDIWETLIGLEALPYLQDHRVRGRVVLPAAGFVEMALAAAAEVFGKGPHAVEAIEFLETLDFGDTPSLPVQLVLSRRGTDAATFQIFAGAASDAERQSWVLHASGTIRARPIGLELSPPGDLAQASASRNGDDGVVASADYYDALAERGYGYGPSFRGIARLWNEDHRVVGELQRPENLTTTSGGYEIHPALLDAAFQLLLAIDGIDSDVPGELWIPKSIESVVLLAPVAFDGELRVVAARRTDISGIAGDLTLSRNGIDGMRARGVRFERVRRNAADEIHDWLYTVGWELAPPVVPAKRAAKSKWLVISGDSADRAPSGGLAEELAAELRAAGDDVAIALLGSEYREVSRGRFYVGAVTAENIERLISDNFAANASDRGGVVFIAAAGLPQKELSAASIVVAQENGSLAALAIAQTLAKQSESAPRLWLITRQAQSVGTNETPNVSVEQAPLWGLGGVIALEHPELHCTRVDIGALAGVQEIRSLAAEMRGEPGEDQIALRAANRFVARLIPFTPEITTAAMPGRAPRVGEGFQLEIDNFGMLDELALHSKERREPGRGEIEIEISAAGLNFIDVMKAMGIYPGLDPEARVALGAECAGTVAAVGDGVTKFNVGDEVVAITTSFSGASLFANYVTLPENFAIHKPAALTFEQAAGVPIAYLTAHYALNHLAHLREGERVLIHSAAGGVGLAAIYLARAVGAKIFATAGTEEKRALLRDMGVLHVMESRHLDFAREIMQATHGEGVDVVLNSLAGEAIPASLGLLRAHGRFLEIGKRDIYENSALGMAGLKKNVSFFAIDLASGIEERPEIYTGMLEELLATIQAGALPPLPVAAHSIASAGETFRYMAKGAHTGKIVFRVKGEKVELANTTAGVAIAADATYLITGGAGDLGLESAKWLVERGARHLALVNRGEPSVSAKNAIAELTAGGAKIATWQADVADSKSLARVIDDTRRQMPPLRGVIHAAGFLQDGTIETMTREQFLAVMAPKVAGAWNLHELTRNAPLDFFVMYSSVAAILGLPGQSNYAAANAFLDSLAHFRRAQGLPALSIDWGPWAGIGLAARERSRGTRLAKRGLRSILPAHGVAALELLLAQRAPQAAVMPFNPQKWRDAYPDASTRFFSALENAAAAPGGDGRERRDFLATLAAAKTAAREPLLATHICEQVGRVLRLAPSKIPANKPFKALGLDSLMTMELRNRLEASLGLKLSAAAIWNHPTVTKLAPFLASRLKCPSAETSVETNGDEHARATLNKENAAETAVDRDAQIDGMTPEEVADLLEAELSSLDERKRKRGRS